MWWYVFRSIASRIIWQIICWIWKLPRRRIKEEKLRSKYRNILGKLRRVYELWNKYTSLKDQLYRLIDELYEPYTQLNSWSFYFDNALANLSYILQSHELLWQSIEELYDEFKELYDNADELLQTKWRWRMYELQKKLQNRDWLLKDLHNFLRYLTAKVPSYYRNYVNQMLQERLNL